MTARRSIEIRDAWPPRMNAEVAAAYCGEKHVEDFLQRVGKTYPEPRWVESTRRKFWYRLDLDRKLGLIEPATGMGGRFAEKVRENRRG